VIADLEFVLAARDQFPVALIRAAHQGLARAYGVVGSHEKAAESLRRSASAPAAPDGSPTFTSFSLTARDGMRLSTPRTFSPAPDVHVAQSYDFGDFAFVRTSAGIVAIDAGTSPDRVLAAIADLGLSDDIAGQFTSSYALSLRPQPVAPRPYVGPSTQRHRLGGFPRRSGAPEHWNPPFRYLIGTDARPSFDITPDELVREERSLVVGDTEFVLIPVRGGETRDALMVHLPASQLLFVGGT